MYYFLCNNNLIPLTFEPQISKEAHKIKSGLKLLRSIQSPVIARNKNDGRKTQTIG